jgi:hypothetical protein
MRMVRDALSRLLYFLELFHVHRLSMKHWLSVIGLDHTGIAGQVFWTNFSSLQ